MLKIWTLVCAIAIGLLLGAAPLFDADEGRNGEVGREMAETNDYVVPHLDGLPYLDKPIVYFAAEAGAMEILGPTELAARLPAYLFTLATAAIVFWFARKLWGVDEACVAAIAFLSMPLTIAFARTVIFDSALTFFIVVAFISFYFAVETEERHWGALAWMAIAFGVLTKGPVAIALPLLVAIPYSIWRKRASRVWSIAGLILFVAIITPWVVSMEKAIPGFLKYVLVTETAQRLTTGALKRTGPPWYFIPYVVGGAFPWLFLPLRKTTKPSTIYLWMWLLIPFVFFSISQSKRPQYILPVMPAIALLNVEAGFSPAGRAKARPSIVIALGLLLFAVPQFVHRLDPSFRDAVTQAAYILGALLIVGGIAAFSKRRDLAIIGLSLPMIAIPIVTMPVMKAIGERRSAKSFIARVAPYVTPHVKVVGVEAFTGSMVFYLQQPIVVASNDGEEFTSNYVIRHYPEFSAAPASPLKPVSWFTQTIDGCCAVRLYIVRDKDVRIRSMLESRGAKVIASGAHFVAYAPRTGGVNRMP